MEASRCSSKLLNLREIYLKIFLIYPHYTCLHLISSQPLDSVFFSFPLVIFQFPFDFLLLIFFLPSYIPLVSNSYFYFHIYFFFNLMALLQNLTDLTCRFFLLWVMVTRFWGFEVFRDITMNSS